MVVFGAGIDAVVWWDVPVTRHRVTPLTHHTTTVECHRVFRLAAAAAAAAT